MELLGSKTVQEVLIQGEQVPDEYIRKVEDGGVPVPDASAAQLMDVPVIDLALLAASTITADELEKFRSALATWGCFQVINHSMSPEFLDEVRENAKQFFALPVADKKKYLRQVNDIQGYGNDMVLSEQQTLDWSDRLYLSVYPQDNRKLNLWPENPKSFSRTLDQYAMELQVVTKTILKAITRSLDLEDTCFFDLYGEQGKMDIRFNFYPPCPRPDLVLGLKPHADGTLITLVLQDKEVEGLQFLKGDRWFRAPIVPDALLINIGDLVEVNHKLLSTLYSVAINFGRVDAQNLLGLWYNRKCQVYDLRWVATVSSVDKYVNVWMQGSKHKMYVVHPDWLRPRSRGVLIDCEGFSQVHMFKLCF